MGFANSPDIFEQKMNDLFHGFEFIRAYIDDILILTKGGWTDHLQKLELPLNKQLKRTPYPMPKINEMSFKLEVFQYVTSLDLNMGYYQIQIRKKKVTYVRLFFRGKNTGTRVYQWEFLTQHKISNRK